MRSRSQLCGQIACGLLLLVTLLAVETGATPTAPPANGSGTLDARDHDPCLPPAEYADRYGHSPTPTQQLATCTDLTYEAPPAHAASRTRARFETLTAGGPNSSVYPPHAELESAGPIADAHVTLFGSQPATRVHLDPTTTRQYIAPNGTVRALIDYRIRSMADQNRSVIDHEVQSVKLQIDGEQVAATANTQTPALSYTTDRVGEQSLTITATIAVTTAPNGSQRAVTTQTITVRDTRSVWVYNLSPDAYTASYPAGATGLAVYQGQPWHGLSLTANKTHRVRGVWRYYTARDTRWDRLRVARATGTSTARATTSAAPLGVVAFPARIGPRAVPVRDGPTLTAVWGAATSTPATRLHENVSVGVVGETYTRSYGLSVRSDRVDPDTVRLQGIVRGTSASLTSVTPTDRPIRQPELTVAVREATASTATLQITLIDPVTGTPIRPGQSNATQPIVADPPPGRLYLNGESVTLDANGTATHTVSEPGLYTVRFEPASWRATTPAYVAVSDTARWHPLGTLAGWLQLLETVVWGAVPVVVAWIAGRQLSHFLSGGSPP